MFHNLSTWDDNSIRNIAIDKKNVTHPEQGYVVINLKGEPLLFPEVKIPDNKKKTFTAVEALFDNYNPNEDGPEIVTNEERKEMALFLQVCCETRLMKGIFEFCKEQKWFTTIEEFKKALFDVWFKLHGKKSRSSFEHIFIGEFEDREGQLEAAQGLHFWYKYAYHDKNIGIKTNKVQWDSRNPYIIGLSYISTEIDEASKQPIQAIKPKGSFLVGMSPEYMLGLGFILFYSKQKGLINNEHDLEQYLTIPYANQMYHWKFIISNYEHFKLIITMYPEIVHNRH